MLYDFLYGIRNNTKWHDRQRYAVELKLHEAFDTAFDKVPKVILDFETFYDPADKYSLRNKGMTYEKYVRDPRFQVIMCSFVIPETGERYWVPNYKGAVRKELEALRLTECNVIAHNNPFDGFILSDYYGIEPLEYSCTMTMARPLHGALAANSLSKLAERYCLPQKLHEVENVAGMRLEDFTKAGLDRYGEYGMRDSDLLAPLYGLFRASLQEQDMVTISDTIRAGCVCQFDLDTQRLRDYIPRLVDLQDERVERVAASFGEDKETFRKRLSSNPQFADILENLGVEVPMKESKTAVEKDGSPKKTYAFAKNDLGFKAIMNSGDPLLEALCEARMGEKSTIGITRATSLMEMSLRGKMPFPLKAFGAGTGRWAGYQGINAQNFPKRGGDITLRQSMRAPVGHSVITCDLSQIEARRMADHAGQDDLLLQFEHNEDPYSVFATKLYGYPVSKALKKERNVGKECIAEGSLVLTDKGLVPIEKIEKSHRVWDGVAFVCHDGIINQGIREVMTYDGVTATPDHEVFCRDGLIRSLSEAAHSGVGLVQTGDSGTAVRFSDSGFRARTPRQAQSLYPLSLRSDERDPMGNLRQCTTGETEILPQKRQERRCTEADTIPPLSSYARPVREPCEPCIPQVWWEGDRSAYDDRGVSCLRDSAELDSDSAVGSRQDRQRRALRGGEPASGYTEGAGSKQIQYADGLMERENDPSLRMAKSLCGDTHLQSYQGGADGGTDCGRRSGVSTGEVQSVAFPTRKVTVYDIANAGPAKRFTVDGRLVLNCILSLQYGSWVDSFYLRLRTAYDLDVTKDFCKDAVLLYRNEMTGIINFWEECDYALHIMLDGGTYKFGRDKNYTATKGRITLPDGWVLRYDNLRMIGNDDLNRPIITYTDMEKRETKKIYRGIVANNVTQGSSARILQWQMRGLREEGIIWCGTVHDELIFIVPNHDIEYCAARIQHWMRQRPQWALRTPIDCELTVGPNYGDQYELDDWLASGCNQDVLLKMKAAA